MPTRRYALEEGGPPRLEVDFTPPAREVRVRLDGAQVAQVSDENALRAEPAFPLPDGSVLRLGQFDPPRPDEPVKVTRNGLPLFPPASAERFIESAARALYFIAALTAVLSLLAIAT